MAEPFRSTDMARLLENKYVLILGDSVQRCIYKDFVCAIQGSKYMTDEELRSKGDITFVNDKLLEGGKLGHMNNGTQYREVREYHTDYHLLRFYFLTRCHSKYLEQVLGEVAGFIVPPDVVILNSCLWDISRYGETSVTTYKKNLRKLVTRLKEVLPPECLVIWNTTLPISSDAKGGFIVPEIEAMTSTLRLDITHANHYANQVMAEAGFDVLDLHFFMRHHIHRRAGDGVHWDMTAHRRITNLLLTHISEAWSRKLPTNSSSCKLADTAKLIETHQAKNAESFDKHVSAVAEAVKARPKAKARRRNRHGSVVPPPMEPPRTVCSMGPQGDFAWPRQNLPLMVDPMERYGGPINIGSNMNGGSDMYTEQFQASKFVEPYNFPAYTSSRYDTVKQYGDDYPDRGAGFRNCLPNRVGTRTAVIRDRGGGQLGLGMNQVQCDMQPHSLANAGGQRRSEYSLGSSRSEFSLGRSEFNLGSSPMVSPNFFATNNVADFRMRNQQQFAMNQSQAQALLLDQLSRCFNSQRW